MTTKPPPWAPLLNNLRRGDYVLRWSYHDVYKPAWHLCTYRVEAVSHNARFSNSFVRVRNMCPLFTGSTARIGTVLEDLIPCP